jgi:signal peptidase I
MKFIKLKKLPLWLDIIVNILVVVIVLYIIRVYVFLPFNVEGQSMEPSLHNGEFIYVDKLGASLFGYDYGDVVVFYPPSQNGVIKKVEERGLTCALSIVKNFILFNREENPCLIQAFFVKRIIAKPGDLVEVENGHVYVTRKNGERTLIPENFLLDVNKGKTCIPAGSCSHPFDTPSKTSKNFGIVPENHYFLLGDNRINSSDSRSLSWDTPFVNEKNITGIVRAVYLSPVQIEKSNSTLKTYWEVFKSIPYSFMDVRFISDENIL